MKKLLLLSAFSLSLLFVAAQSNVQLTKFDNTEVDGVVAEFPYSYKTVEEAFQNMMAKKGYKSKNRSGYAMYEGVNIPELGLRNYDVYFKAQKKSRRESDKSVGTMLISSGNANFLTALGDQSVFVSGKTMVNNLMGRVGALDLNKQTQDQEDLVKNELKKLNSLKSAGEDLQRKKTNIEKDIVNNQADLDKQQVVLASQQAALDALKQQQNK